MTGKQSIITLRRLPRYLFIILMGIGFLALFSYLYQAVTSRPAVTAASDRQRAIADVRPTETLVLPTPTPLIGDYRTILLLEHGTELMVKYIEKVSAGEIDPHDASVRQAYLQAFPLAIDAYNHTTPAAGMEHNWKNVTLVTQAYALVYPVLQRGDLVSEDDLSNMKSARQWLINYQDTEESILSSRGMNAAFFSAEQLAVDQLLQNNYGSTPVPALSP